MTSSSGAKFDELDMSRSYSNNPIYDEEAIARPFNGLELRQIIELKNRFIEVNGLREEEELYVQTKVIGIFSAAILLTSGLRACAPGARRCAAGNYQPTDSDRIPGGAYRHSIHPSPSPGRD